jgi:hypothetical protein
MLKVLGSIPRLLFHFLFFFNELATERKTMLKAFVSYFNELATEKRNYARDLYFIF